MEHQLTSTTADAESRRFLSATLVPALTDELRKVSPGCVHLLRLADLARSDWARLAGLLDAAETRRAAGLRFQADRDAFIAAHGLLRLALACRLGTAPAQLGFTRQPGGKPVLTSGPAIDFSLSHARTAVCCILADDARVGIDIEPTRSPPAHGEGLFCPEEIAWLRARPTGYAASDFTALWCRKEALLKSLAPRDALDMAAFSAIPGRAVGLAAGSGFCGRDIAVTSHLTPDSLHMAIAARPAAG